MFKKGDKVRVTKRGQEGAEHALTEGREYRVQNQIDDMVYLVNDDRMRNKYEGEGWFAHRFELVKEAPANAAIIPLTLENAKVGMKVVLNNLDGLYNRGAGDRLLGQVCTIGEMSAETPEAPVRLVESPNQPLKISRFSVYQEDLKVQPIGPGSKLIVVQPHRDSGLRADKIVTLKYISPNGKLYKLEEYPALYKASRFAPVGGPIPAPAKPVEVPLKASDKVYVIGGDSEYVNDGVKYEIYAINSTSGVYLCEIGYWVPLKDVVRATAANKPVVTPYEGELRKDIQKKDNGSKITSFAFLADGRARPQFCVNPACYAQIDRAGGSIVQFALSTKAWKGIGDEFVDIYMKWLFNDSPWALSFVTKDVEDAKENGVEMDTNRPIGELVGAATAMREATEFPKRNPMFMWGIENGFDVSTSYLLGANINKTGNKFTFHFANGSHQAMDSTSTSAEAIISFFANGFPDKGQKPAKESPCNFSVCRWIGGGGRSIFSEFITANTKTHQVGDGWNSVTTVEEQSIKEFATLLQQKIKEAKK